MIFCGLAIGRVIAPIGQRAELERYTRGFCSCCRMGEFGGNKGQRTCLLLFVTAAPGDMMLIFCYLCYGRLQLQLLQLFFLML